MREIEEERITIATTFQGKDIIQQVAEVNEQLASAAYKMMMHILNSSERKDMRPDRHYIVRVEFQTWDHSPFFNGLLDPREED